MGTESPSRRNRSLETDRPFLHDGTTKATPISETKRYFHSLLRIRDSSAFGVQMYKDALAYAPWMDLSARPIIGIEEAVPEIVAWLNS
jgi:hypothetical protein